MDHNSPGGTNNTSTPTATTASAASTNATHTSAELWSQFRSHSLQYHAKNHERTALLVFEDVEAKAAQRQQKMERLWIRSAEKNSVVFDLRRHALLGTTFLDALHVQYPEAIGVDSKRGEQNGIAIVAFDSVAARVKACTIGVTIDDSLTIIANETVEADSNVVRLQLEGLPLLRATELAPLVTRALSPYGKVLHVNMYTDERGLFFGKGSATIDATATEMTEYKALNHEIPLGRDRLFYAKWRGMPKHCFYCKQSGHLRMACPRRKRGPKLCFGCHSDTHLIADCPKVNTTDTGNKRQRPGSANELKESLVLVEARLNGAQEVETAEERNMLDPSPGHSSSNEGSSQPENAAAEEVITHPLQEKAPDHTSEKDVSGHVVIEASSTTTQNTSDNMEFDELDWCNTDDEATEVDTDMREAQEEKLLQWIQFHSQDPSVRAAQQALETGDRRQAFKLVRQHFSQSKKGAKEPLGVKSHRVTKGRGRKANPSSNKK